MLLRLSEGKERLGKEAKDSTLRVITNFGSGLGPDWPEVFRLLTYHTEKSSNDNDRCDVANSQYAARQVRCLSTNTRMALWPA